MTKNKIEPVAMLPTPVGNKRVIPSVEPMSRTKRRRTMIELPVSRTWKPEERGADEISLRHITNSLMMTKVKHLPKKQCKKTPDVCHQKTTNAITKLEHVYQTVSFIFVF